MLTKSKSMILIMALSALFWIGCEDDDDVLIDRFPPAPQGVYSVTGDNEVYVYWSGPYDGDIDYYVIYRSFDPIDNYVEIGTVNAYDNPNLDLLYYEYIDDNVQNGVTYFYAVATVDHAGQESDLSAENVFDTPRPEGQVRLYDTSSVGGIPTQSGYSFPHDSVVSWDSPLADIWVDRVGGIFYLNASLILETDFQDMGYTETFDEIGYAPREGWSALPYLELVTGHTYVIWTDDLHFAKLRVLSKGSNSVLFEWAYQTDTDNPELIAPLQPQNKPFHNGDFSSKASPSASLK